MPFKNWLAICEIPNPLMRAWISSEEDPQRLSRAQVGFPELFTDKPEEGKTGPFPLSYLRELMNLEDEGERHVNECDEDPEEECVLCKKYSNLPDFPVPCINLQMENVPDEILAQIRSYVGSEIPYEMYFPHKLYEIAYRGQTFYLGYVDILNISLCMKEAVYIDE